MEMATAIRTWTRADLASLPDDGNRYEVLNGQLLVTPQASGGHQQVAFRLARLIADYCDRHKLGEVVTPGAVPFKDNELQPDIQVIPGQISPLPESWDEIPLPILVVEVLSGSTGRRDRGIKRTAYMAFGIAEYWIVDRKQRTVTVVRSGRDDEHHSTTLHWQPQPEFPPFEIRLDTIFR
jgi:Uma2 family endonuclease